MITEKLYLPIKNCRYDKNLFSYLEEICNNEHIQILEEYQDSYSWINPKPTLHSIHDANPSSDALLCSTDENKLYYVNYLYENFRKNYEFYGNESDKIVDKYIDNKSDKAIDSGVKAIDEQISYWQKDLADSFALFFQEYEKQGWVSHDFMKPREYSAQVSFTLSRETKIDKFKNKCKKIWNIIKEKNK